MIKISNSDLVDLMSVLHTLSSVAVKEILCGESYRDTLVALSEYIEGYIDFIDRDSK